jgi:iron(III) transport system substrate-binding protein
MWLLLSGCQLLDRETNSLVIYSGRTEAFMKPIIAEFQARYPEIRVQLKSGKNNELAATILEEQAYPQGDVFVSTDQLTHINLSRQGGLQSSVFVGSDTLDPRIRAHDGTWYAVTLRTRAIMYNTDMIRADAAPQSMLDLVDPRWRGQVVMADSNNGPMQAQVAAMLTLLGQDVTKAWLTGLVANQTTFLAAATDIRKAVGNGEYAIGLLNSYNYELQRREADGANVGIIYPDQQAGQMGLLVNTTAVGVIRRAPNERNAQRFMEFLFATETQRLFADLNLEYPVVAGVAPAPGIPALANFHVADIDMQRCADRVPEAIALMQSVGIP